MFNRDLTQDIFNSAEAGKVKMGKVKHFSLFSGIESFKKAMTNLGIENELVGYSEIDKYASVALSAIHGVSEELNYEGLGEDDVKELKEHLELAIEALKKQEMRKIVIVKVPKKWGGQVAKCPNCGEILIVPWLHCHYCGQRLDWSVEE